MRNLKIVQATAIGGLTFFLPFITLAAVNGTGKGLGDTLGTISALINGIIPLILAFAVLVFFWGLASYLMNSGNTDKKKDGINIMIMGIITIFVMVSLWGIVIILQNTFGVKDGKVILPDSVKFQSSTGAPQSANNSPSNLQSGQLLNPQTKTP